MTNPRTPHEAPPTADPAAPCQCVTSHSAVSPTHRGHCCFLPATRTCHQAEVAAWEERRQLVVGHR